MVLESSGRIHLGLLLHHHQPVGNFPWVFQQVYEASYIPLLSALERHPGIRLSLHYTGSLMDWLEKEHPEFIERVVALVKRGQVEIVGGGYYEPILPSIPDEDKLLQIRRLSERLQREFGQRPQGMWMAERVWEPSLPRFLHEAGIEWTLLDDIHFKNVGLSDSDLYGYYATEEQGNVVKVFATSQALRYTIPWRPPQETIDVLRNLATSGGERIIVMGDDGEKFGAWPGTQEYCWGDKGNNGWVDEFFTLLEANSAWIRTTPIGEYAQNYPALGRVYIPTSSYIEMTQWALPPRKGYQFEHLLHQLEQDRQVDILQFMRGGFWRNFLVRYAEINNQHKKMLRVHEHVYRAGATDQAGITYLLKAQANDTYWHGLFGGIYMSHVRSAIYHYLIKAEKAADRLIHGTEPWQTYEVTDFECNTQQKILIESDQQNIYLDPLHGGTLFEWDIKRTEHNLLSVMTRREESYHRTLREYEQQRRSQPVEETEIVHDDAVNPHTTVRVKELNLDRYLVIDHLRRSSLVDHFLPYGLQLENYVLERYKEQGDFAGYPYQAHVEQLKTGIQIILQRDGHVQRPGALSAIPLRVTKTIFVPLGEEQLIIDYKIVNTGQTRLQTLFGSEWNINLLGGGGNLQAYGTIENGISHEYRFDTTGETESVRHLALGNTWLDQDVQFSPTKAATLWRFSVDTVPGSEGGFERTHQGSSFTFLWDLLLEPAQPWEMRMTITGYPAR